MVLPTTYLSALLLLIVSLICWGSWANTVKVTGAKWRFELFYFDYSLGVLLLSLVAAYTFGTLGADISFNDRLLVAGRRNEAWVFGGGVVFNLANMLLVAAISMAGLSVAFPIGIGLALIIGVILNYVIAPQGNPILLFCGVAVVFAAILFDAAAYRARDQQKVTGAPVKSGASTTKGVIVSLISGIFMGLFYPMVEQGMSGDLGTGPYGAMIIFATGVVISTFLFNIYFINLAIFGKRIPLNAYFRGTGRQHLIGIGGGALWGIGALTNFLAASAPASVNVGPAIGLAIGQCGTLVSVLWGLLVWKEFAGAATSAKRWLAIMIATFVLGLGLLSLAPVI